MIARPVLPGAAPGRRRDLRAWGSYRLRVAGRSRSALGGAGTMSQTMSQTIAIGRNRRSSPAGGGRGTAQGCQEARGRADRRGWCDHWAAECRVEWARRHSGGVGITVGRSVGVDGCGRHCRLVQDYASAGAVTRLVQRRLRLPQLNLNAPPTERCFGSPKERMRSFEHWKHLEQLRSRRSAIDDAGSQVCFSCASSATGWRPLD